MFFGDWASLGRVVVIGPLVYLGMVLLLRVSGKRSLSKLNAFDFVVTVALGSSLASAILSKQTSVAEGVLAFAVLIGLQYVVTWCSVRWRWFERLVNAEPSLLVRRGEFLEAAMRKQRVTREEVREVLRSGGHPDVENVAAVVLETDGSFSVLGEVPDWSAKAMTDLRRVPAGQ